MSNRLTFFKIEYKLKRNRSKDMKLGTIVYENEIYNLDYMTSDEIKTMIHTIESDKFKNINDAKKID